MDAMVIPASNLLFNVPFEIPEDAEGWAVEDDHVPFLEQGIPVVAIVQTPFPSYWHTRSDTPDRCSRNSLQQVGNVLVEGMYGE